MAKRQRRRPEPKAIAQWRYDQIVDALAEPHRRARAQAVCRICRTPVLWPNGTTHTISPATVYRWIDAYQTRGGLEGLRPAPRRDRGLHRAKLPDEVVKKALALLIDDPELGFTMLDSLLRADPELQLNEKKIKVARSTLWRRVVKDPLYAIVRRARKQQERRGRFVARKVHDLVHLDAKGPIEITLVSGEKLSFHVLTVLDDASRAVLAALVVLTPDLCAAVRVFRMAVERWGLAHRFYADRASIFDTPAFRNGLAVLGCHRIKTKGRNAPAHGKIERWHGCLSKWFVRLLARQKLVDLAHIQQLLDAMIERVYQDHRHRGIKRTPREALANQVSERQVTAQRLYAVFRQEKWLKAHPKTGEVDIRGTTYLVPTTLRAEKLRFLIDPDPRVPPTVVDPTTEQDLPLVRAKVAPEDAPAISPETRWGAGPLQQLYDAWQGKVRPIAEPGFGFPELLTLLSQVVGRRVPRTDAEAALVQRMYSDMGPLPKRATTTALESIGRRLGPGRPVRAYLDALKSQVAPSPLLPMPVQRRKSK